MEVEKEIQLTVLLRIVNRDSNFVCRYSLRIEVLVLGACAVMPDLKVRFIGV
jgi:hypothetical protein